MNKIINPNSYKIDGCFLDRETGKYCLIHIYKNASISTRNVLNMRGNYFKFNNVKNKDGLVTICIIRDPIERIISIYFYMLRDEDYGFKDQHPVDLIRESNFFIHQDNLITSFNEFLEQLEGGNFFSAVTLPQSQFLKDRDLDLEDIDEVWVQESLNKDFASFKRKYNIKPSKKLLIDNSSDNIKKITIQKYIKDNIDVQRKIKQIYKIDFDLYNKALDIQRERDYLVA
jgi:hypothetical protein